MKTSDFDYYLPPELIAQTPIEPRDAGRMLVCARHSEFRRHMMFADLPKLLMPRDVLVLNRSRVIPARLMGMKSGSGIPCEVLLLKRIDQYHWEALVRPGRRLPPGTAVQFGDGELSCDIISETSFGGRLVRFRYQGIFEETLNLLGEMPLPPYIHQKLKDQARYQTVYAREEGSAAAPTAGLHFTENMLAQIREKGIKIATLLLHVGLGTFRPVKEDNVDDHVMHSEEYIVSQEAADTINAARGNGGRIVCVGTTCVRTLETVSDDMGVIRPGHGATDIFIKPGYRFRAVDMLLTNFHLPQSTLVMLVSAFMGQEKALSAYREAVRDQYRFFSFGDCMLIGDDIPQVTGDAP